MAIIIQPRKRLFHLDLHAVWDYRELLFFLIWRDVKVRYKPAIPAHSLAVSSPDGDSLICERFAHPCGPTTGR